MTGLFGKRENSNEDASHKAANRLDTSTMSFERDLEHHGDMSYASMTQDAMALQLARKHTGGGRRAWVYPALPWGAVNKYAPGYLRGSKAMLFWELLIIACIAYTAIRIPYDLAFEQDNEAFKSSVCKSCEHQAWDVVSDILHLVDVVVQMHSAYFVMSDDGSGMWVLIDQLSVTYRIYFSSFKPWGRSFFWDVMCFFPFHHIGCATWPADETGNSARVLDSFRLLRTFKLLRLWRIRGYITFIKMYAPNWGRVFTITRLMIFLFFSAHYLGCLWFAIGFTEDGWMPMEGGIKDDDGIRFSNNWLYEWMTVFYWSVTTMTTIGYGDISAHTTNERIFAVFGMVIGVSFFAWLSGTVTDVIGKSSLGYQRFMEFISEVQSYLDIKQVPMDLRKRVMSLYGLRFPTQTIFNEADILGPLPPGLRKTVVAHTYMSLLDDIPLFKTLTTETKVEICNLLQPLGMTEDTEIFLEETDPDGLYIVRFGVISLSSKGYKLPDAHTGVMFGEIGLLGLTANGSRLRTAISKTECEILSLSKMSVKILMLNHGDLRNRFRQLAAGHLKLIHAEASKVYSQLYLQKFLVRFLNEWQAHGPGYKPPRGRMEKADLFVRNSDDYQDLDPEDELKANFSSTKPHVNIPQMIQTGVICTVGFIRGIPFMPPEEDGMCTLTFRLEWAKTLGEPGEVKFAPGGDLTVLCEVLVEIRIMHRSTNPARDQNDLRLHIYIRDKEIAVATIPVMQALSNETGLTQGKWQVGGHEGMMEISYTPKACRYLTETSLLKWQVRGILNRMKDTRRLLKLWGEIKEGVVHVMAKGESGKTSSDKTSAARDQAKQGLEILSLIEELQDQFLAHGKQIRQRFTDQDKRLEEIKASAESNGLALDRILENLGMAKRERITYTGSLEERLAATEVGMYAREQKVLEITLATARNVDRMSKQFNQLSGYGGGGNLASFGVGIMFEIREDFSSARGPDGPVRYIYVKEVVLGGPAYKGGTVAPGDVLIRVDDIRIEGFSLDQIEHLILGKEGTPVMLSFRRPTTGTTFMAPLVRERVRRMGSL